MNATGIEKVLKDMIARHAAERRALRLQNEALFGQIHQLRQEVRRGEEQRQQASVCRFCGVALEAERQPIVEEREIRKSSLTAGEKRNGKYAKWLACSVSI